MNIDNKLSLVLHELGEVAGPDGMADNALRRARRQRLKGYTISTFGALTAAVLIAAPFVLAGGAGTGEGGRYAVGAPAAPAPSAAVAANSGAGPCEAATSEPGVKKVLPQDWPGYVKATIDRLPARGDYVMQSGSSGVCEGMAYSVINLGESREAGHITVRLNGSAEGNTPVDCTKVQAANTNPEAPPPPHPFQVLFCEEGGGFRMVYGIDDGYNGYRVTAVYPDGRTVAMESIGADSDTAPTITAERLRAVVTDPAMLAFF